MRRIISYNVNGIRAAVNKGLMEWFKAANPDVLLLQETKAQPEQINVEAFEELGYKVYLHSAQKKGYSGVALITKQEPDLVEIGMGLEKYDAEGRVIRADYKDYSVMGVYMPSGSSGELRQEFKFEWLDDFQGYIDELKSKLPNMVIGGDFNICHTEIDIHNPKANVQTSGFLPEEREWVTKFIDSGWVDSFRAFNKDPHNYTWWSYRAGARPKNLGWRIDYNFVSDTLKSKMKRAAILPEAKHSDHCPVLLEME